MASLLLYWRQLHSNTLRKLVLDGVKLAFLAELLYGIGHSAYDELSFITDNSMISDRIYLSVNGQEDSRTG